MTFTAALVAAAAGMWLINELKRWSKAKPSVLVPQSMVEFFANRTALDVRLPLREIFKEGNRISGYFLSGEGIFSSDKNRLNYTKRLILPKPTGSYVGRLHAIFPQDYLNAPRQIKITTKLAKERGIDIRWFDDFVGMGILFCNPEESNGWAQIEFSIPFIEAGEKQAIRIEKADHPGPYAKIYEAFNKMWDDSRKPEASEYET